SLWPEQKSVDVRTRFGDQVPQGGSSPEFPQSLFLEGRAKLFPVQAITEFQTGIFVAMAVQIDKDRPAGVPFGLGKRLVNGPMVEVPGLGGQGIATGPKPNLPVLVHLVAG